MRLSWACAAVILSAVPFAAEPIPSELTAALARLDADAAKLSSPMRANVQIDAAETLAERFPDLVHKYIAAALAELKSQTPIDADSPLLFGLATVAPEEAVALLPQMKPGAAATLSSALLRADRVELAKNLYLTSLETGPVRPAAAMALLSRLAKDRPADAAKVFGALLAKIDWKSLGPLDTYYLVACAYSVQAAAPELAAGAYEKVALAVSSDSYAPGSLLTATFQLGKTSLSTTNTRDTLLVLAGARLHDLDGKKFDQHKSLLDKWDLAGGFAVKSLNSRTAASAVKPDAGASPITAIQKAMGTMRSLPTDDDRAQLVLKLTAQIRELPDAATRASLADNLSNLATEGDLGAKALTAIVDVMGQAMHQYGKATLGEYTQLATLMRYEHIPAPIDDPALTAAGDLLVLREAIHEGMPFSLTALDGKTYSLSGLKGHVVLLNFWATWCPPCRKEMPDMEKLYTEFSGRGFVVLAVSDEERDTVAGFIAKQPYTYPILLDPGREVHKGFGVEGIPKSFLFNRDGKIVAQAIDMRTERQFRGLLKTAGLE